ncbi:MAG: LysM peptidoglycan-binding domain-containing protein [Bacteroidales bacterium]|nr:LysM peptidoglycan-binding domain-containing protein [Bacteroidales bacterium]
MIIRLPITFLVFLFFAGFGYAQQTPVKVDISKEKVTIKGEIFYLHSVEKQQTLYSIAKKYGAEIGTIIKDNPSLASGLKEGDKIYIRAANVTEQKSTQEPSKKPEPSKQLQDSSLVNNIQAEHIVRWYENLSSIAKKYGVTEQEIMRANSLQNRRVETRMVLKIPVADSSQEVTGKMESDTLVNSEKKISETPATQQRERRGRDIFSGTDKKYIASLVLPLNGNSEVKNETAESFMEFYQGFLVALDDIKRDFPGSNLEIRVFDIDSYSSSEEMISKGVLQGSHIIIGPMFNNQLEPVLKYATEREISVISPNPASEHLTLDNSSLFQVTTPLIYIQNGIFSKITRFSEVAVIFEDGGSDTNLISITRNLLNERYVNYRQLSYDILRGRSILPQMTEMLKSDKINHVIVASNSEAFVSDVLRNLNLIQTMNGYNISVYGTPRWRNFENVDINYYHGMNLTISTQYYVDYSKESVQRFISRFRALYNSEPSQYAFQAYDIAYYFLSALIRYGEDFKFDLADHKKELLQSDFNFILREGDKGYTNSAIRQVLYKPDYSIDVKGLNR